MGLLLQSFMVVFTIAVLANLTMGIVGEHQTG